MPKETFNKLSQQKRERFIQIALKEFANHNFETASITKIVKELGIAKGSVYQYFEDKLDLWLFLKNHAEQVKFGYIKNLNRDDYKDFWMYYKQMFREGVKFDLNDPLCSKFLYRIGSKENSPQVQDYLNSWKKMAFDFFIQLIKEEKKKGTFSKKLNDQIAAHFMISMSMSVAELMQMKYDIDFDENLSSDKNLFAQYEKELLKSVDELIKLLKKALQP